MKQELSLHNPIDYLPGVGPQKAEVLQKELKVFTCYELLMNFPFRHEDRSRFIKVNQIHPNSEQVQLVARIKRLRYEGQGRKKRLVMEAWDDTGYIELVWFKGATWMKKTLLPEKVYVIYGRISNFKGKLSIAHPEMTRYDVYRQQPAATLLPVYHSSDKLNQRGFHSKGIQNLVSQVIQNYQINLDESLPEYIRKKFGFPERKDAILQMHFPSDSKSLEQATDRIKYEELFYLQLGMLKTRQLRKNSIKGHVFEQAGELLHRFYKEVLPFELTNAQKRVLKEIRADVYAGWQMNRLLQGDVGSGKTMVAIISMLMAKANSFQSCLMAPTEILATQHYQSFKELLGPLEVSIELLTGSTKAAERRRILAELESGEVDFIIGTHALLEDRVVFKSLGLAVIDEQHRFGVAQRARLWAKADMLPPHVLVMTATPIPRTLAMSVYGDLDLSVIDELPPGRKDVQTEQFKPKDRLKLWSMIKKQIALGRQVYIVYPLIEESETLDYQDLMDGYESVLRDFPAPDYRVSMVHGKMKPADKEMEMQRFVNQETQIMVATTVIEVGVNVPNASVMLIESAERFGLSQLHQLRGRVGRGADQSYCFLLTGDKLSEEAKTRVSTMCETNDGFEIAEVDMRLRGPGDMLGTRQSGMLELKLASLTKDGHWLTAARKHVAAILEKDPNLELPEHEPIKTYLKSVPGKKTKWALIS